MSTLVSGAIYTVTRAGLMPGLISAGPVPLNNLHLRSGPGLNQVYVIIIPDTSSVCHDAYYKWQIICFPSLSLHQCPQ